MERAMSASRYIVCHAGVGLITTALRLGRRPIVIARRQSGGEHFDDHQLQIVEKLGGLGLLVSATDSLTEDHLRAADAPMENASWGVYPRLADVLAEELAGLASHASRRLRRRARRTRRPSGSDGDA
jgi:UDP-N-acetylglucosamine transferase subunit ALG13